MFFRAAGGRGGVDTPMHTMLRHSKLLIFFRGIVMRNTFTSFNVDPNASRFSQFQLNSLRLEFLVKKLKMYLIFFILLHQQFNQVFF